MRRIAIDCLNCGHFVSMDESDLQEMGFNRDESLLKVTKKLICSRCKSKAVSAYRYIDDELQAVLLNAP